MQTTGSSKGSELQQSETIEVRARAFAWPAMFFALLQSTCTALIAASGLRFAINLSSLISAIVTSSPAQHFHQDAIRVPMLTLALLGALINLIVLWQVRRLRRRPAAQWRISQLSMKKKRMEPLQLVLSLLTILLVVAELVAHKHLHGSIF